MPIYEFHCQKCDVDFEQLFRSASDRPKCPDCGGRKVRRKLSLFGMASGGGDGGERRTNSSSCASCRATSCAGCRR